VEDPKAFIVSSKSAGFALEPWPMKEKYLELRKPVGEPWVVDQTMKYGIRNYEYE
jgi:hypothetical protein